MVGNESILYSTLCYWSKDLLEVVSFYHNNWESEEKVKGVSRSVMSDCDFMNGSPQAPLSTEFSGQEYWSGLSFLSPEYLPEPGV